MKVFSGSANFPLAQKIAQYLGETVSPRELFVFPDGERRVQIQENVVDEDTVVVQPTATPVDSNYMELFFLCDSLKRSGARSVTAVVPYLGYQRQDHVFRDGEAVSLAVIVKMLESIGVDRVISCDLHSIKIPEFFTIPMTHLSALPLFAHTIREENLLKNSVLISPDMGGIRRIKQMSEMLDGLPYAVLEKDRNLDTGNVAIVRIEGEVAKRALIVDDMISSGGTIVKAADFLRQRGVEEIVIFVTHAVFSKEAPKLLQESLITKVYVTDSVYVSEEKRFAKLEILSLADMMATSLRDHEVTKQSF
ncbi:MAG: ribose-phosphate pyrophosphokinase [Patescibacteria group bacterium]